MGARMVPENGQTTKTKQIFYICHFGWKAFPSYYKYIHRVQFFFSKRGVCLYWVARFYWDIYGTRFNINIEI